MSDSEYISFGPVMNPDGTPTEFTKQMFGVQDDPLADIKGQIAARGWMLMDTVPDRDNMYIVIVSHPKKGTFSTHATEWANRGLCWGHYDIPTYELARKDALTRALKTCENSPLEYTEYEGE